MSENEITIAENVVVQIRQEGEEIFYNIKYKEKINAILSVGGVNKLYDGYPRIIYRVNNKHFGNEIYFQFWITEKEMEYGARMTQFHYIPMGMPEIFRYKSLAGFTRLQSWWMNHWFIFHREAATRVFTGHAGYNPKLKVTLGDKINYLKYILIAGVILNTLGYERSYMLGTAPTSLPPTAGLALGIYNYYTNLGDDKWKTRKRAQASREIKQAALTFIPGYLSLKDAKALLSGDKHWTEFLFYKKAAAQRGKNRLQF